MENNLLIVVSGCLTLGSTIVTGLLAAYRDANKARLEERQREWDIQDRREKAEMDSAHRAATAAAVVEALKKQADEVTEALKAQAAKLALETTALGVASKQQTETVLSKIQENTDVSTAAFDVANHVNDKLIGIHARIDAVKTDAERALELHEKTT